MKTVDNLFAQQKLAEVRVGQSGYEQLVDHDCCSPPVKVYGSNQADWKKESE